ncbi:histidine phosphatase family protein [Amycolatopsis antarctica]|uniref:Histidine phosphatase family protein n=1 Tax=Amycolatopsis antarctica TaxID=1854586 RepID=A0A263D4R7_9PSEU|nr:histidine phosphatase family protein [Amycolatopsis antarctica]OZM73189.1 histidine phosphatase family protein [Amycolatopsis antarctica]
MKLYLIRHAQSTANVRKALDTALPGPPLTDLGREQAEALADELADVPVAAVYASEATRAQQTAAPLGRSKGLDVQVLKGVQEVYVGDLEGNTDRESIQTYVDTVGPWLRGDLGGAMPGGESGEQVRSRYLGAVGDLRARHADTDPDAVVALVSHGGAIRLGADWLSDNVRPEFADVGLLPNTGIVVLETLPDGGWTCLRWAGVTV